MKVFFLVDGDDEHGIVGAQQALGKEEAPLHHGEPFGVAILVGLVNVVVVVFPVARAGVVGRVDVDAIHPAGADVGQELQGIVVVGLDEGVPGAVGRGMAHRVDGFEVGIDGALVEALGQVILKDEAKFLLLCQPTNLGLDLPSEAFVLYLCDELIDCSHVRVFVGSVCSLFRGRKEAFRCTS